MAHEIDTTTGRAAVFTTGEVPWHGLGITVSEAVESTQAIRLAALDWRVEQWPVSAHAPDGWGTITAKEHVANVRTDTRAVLGVVGKRYQPFQNAEAFAFADSIVGEGHAKYETAGSLRGGRRVWMLLKLPQEIYGGPEDQILPYMLLFNSHDGSSCLRALLTTVRVVCANTLRLAMRGHDREGVSLRHRGDLHGRVEEARRTLGLVQKRLNVFEREVGVLRSVPMTGGRLQRYFDSLLPPLAATASDRERKNRLAALDQLNGNFENPLNTLTGMRGTLWAALNAATEYADHQRRVRGNTDRQRRENRLDSIWFGSAADFKQSAWHGALEMAGLN